jgi:transcriptional regulator with XRE-family HTH domain
MARRRITAASLARRIGVSRTALGERLNGDKAFNTDQLFAIAQVLEIDFLDLFPAEAGSTSSQAAS